LNGKVAAGISRVRGVDQILQHVESCIFQPSAKKVPVVLLKLADFGKKPSAKVVVVFYYAGEVKGGGRHSDV
jgi:hypothetical protein